MFSPPRSVGVMHAAFLTEAGVTKPRSLSLAKWHGHRMGKSIVLAEIPTESALTQIF